MNLKKWTTIGAAVLALAAALGVSGLAFAQTATPPAAAQTDLGPAGHGRHGGPLQEYLQPALAEAFGVTVEELQALRDGGRTLKDLAIEQDLTVAEFEARMQAARQSAIDAALEDGAITQKQADWLRSRLEQGKGLRPGHGDRPLREYMDAALAEAFGVTVEELQALRAEGQTLKDLAIEQDLTVAEFETRMQSARQSAIEAALEDGAITQQQADWLKARLEDGQGPRGPRPGGRP